MPKCPYPRRDVNAALTRSSRWGVMVSRDDSDPLARLDAAVRADDPAFADGMATLRPGPPREYRRAAWRATLCRFTAAICVLAAVKVCTRPLLSGLFLLTALGFAMADGFTATPPDLDGPRRSSTARPLILCRRIRA